MDKNLQSLRDYITQLATRPSFRHSGWFVKYHLEYVEALSLDLLNYYPEANKDIVIAMCWMHDYGKIIDFDKQYDHVYIEQSRRKMIELGLSESFAGTVSENIKVLDSKVSIKDASIEVQIVSSADGCSHLVGPFSSLFWWENPDMPFEDIMKENIRKQSVDWDQKVVLPEARAAYAHLHEAAMNRASGVLLHI